MKNCVYLLVAVLMNGPAFASNVDMKMTGDTIGAAQSNLSSLWSTLERAQEIRQIDVLGQQNAAVKQFCSLVGGAVATAYAVQREIRFYTNLENEAAAGVMILDLIDRTGDVQNNFCFDSKIGLTEAKAQLKEAERISRELMTLLETARLK